MTVKEKSLSSQGLDEEKYTPYYASEEAVRGYWRDTMKKDLEEMIGPQSTQIPIPTYSSYRYRRKKVPKPER